MNVPTTDLIAITVVKAYHLKVDTSQNVGNCF